MKRITLDDYNNYKKLNDTVTIEDNKIKIGEKNIIETLEPENFPLEIDNVWSFPERGKWCTHYLNARYRGNYAPQLPRNIILRYSKENDLILDPFSGSGTTLIEAKLLKRHGIGVDINLGSAMIAMDRLDFNNSEHNLIEPEIYNGDARNLNEIDDESIDLIMTHPPYTNIIKYSKNDIIKDDLSSIDSLEEYYNEFKKVINEMYRTLKKGKYCVILIGDTRKKGYQIPISFTVMQLFLKEGFVLKEDIIKVQHNTKTWHYWESLSVKNNFLLLAYEHLFVFKKL
ncbi:TRM11 family SAM-dependent methyltransferase [Ferroplasma acidiphilum]|uniref:Type II methyltransferase n=1 Tax=Ferroplasma acidiphilum TaxID=74969 RepID=A0A7K4FNZ6_9ARCH|nr:DNA methyltransferase [Ferroplasma acidiphilum]NOL60736.1 N-6 DNA methylase [Ferroplasma acidiphilum]